MIDKQELKNEILQAQKTNRLSDNLTAMLTELFTGVSRRYYTGSCEDMTNHLWIHFLEKNILQKIDLKKPFCNPFNYLIQISRMKLITISKRECLQRERLAALIQNVGRLATEKNLN